MITPWSQSATFGVVHDRATALLSLDDSAACVDYKATLIQPWCRCTFPTKLGSNQIDDYPTRNVFFWKFAQRLGYSCQLQRKVNDGFFLKKLQKHHDHAQF